MHPSPSQQTSSSGFADAIPDRPAEILTKGPGHDAENRPHQAELVAGIISVR
jgi:hypothetical protein